MDALTLDILLEKLHSQEQLLPNRADSASPRQASRKKLRQPRIRLMRHAFRGCRSQLDNVRKWTKALGLTVDIAYPKGMKRPSAGEVLNAVRFDERLARLVSAEQGEDCLVAGDLILAFAATGGKSAEFLAAFRVKGRYPNWQGFRDEYADLLVEPPTSAQPLLPGRWLVRQLGYNALPSDEKEVGFYYQLERCSEVLAGLERRLVVKWKSPVKWLQNDLNKEVLEIRPKGFVREFTGYLDFTLDFKELRAIVGRASHEKKSSPELAVDGPSSDVRTKDIDGDPVWRERLGRVVGVYIVQTGEGDLYVGAAYGKGKGGNSGGFLGRWNAYAGTHDVALGEDDNAGLRGNTGMRKYLTEGCSPAEQKRRLFDLRFSIAHVMDSSARDKEVLQMESWFKQKLGSRAHGLNDN
jgi:hypothetical protein